MRALVRALPRLVARIPAAVHTKLLVAFLIIVGLLIALGAVGLEVLGEVNRRSEDLVKLQRKIAAYRQMQHDTTAQLYSVDRKSTRLNSSHSQISYAVFCLKKKKR